MHGARCMARGQSNRPARKWFANTCVAIVSNNRRRKLAVVKYQTSLMWSASQLEQKWGFIWLGFPFVRILRNQRRQKSTLQLTKTRKNKRDLAIRIFHGNLLKFYSSCLISSYLHYLRRYLVLRPLTLICALL